MTIAAAPRRETRAVRSIHDVQGLRIYVPMKLPAMPPNSMPSSSSLAVQTASDAVFNGILQGLEQRRFVPGQRLVESDLVTAFGVSRTSVREALQRLEADGLIEIVRNKGAVIRTLSIEGTLEVLEVAERMTGLLARSAARRIAAGGSGEMMEQAMHALVEADASRDPEAFSRARRALYRALLSTSGSQELRRLFPSIQMPIVHAQHRVDSLQKIRMLDYANICTAVLAGDADQADAAGMQHVRNVQRELLRASEATAGAAQA